MIYEESAFKQAVKSYSKSTWEILNVTELLLEKIKSSELHLCKFTSNLIDAIQRLDTDAQRSTLISAGADANTVGGFKDCMEGIKKLLSDRDMISNGTAICVLDIALSNIGSIRYKDGIIVIDNKHTKAELWVIDLLNSFRPSLNIVKATDKLISDNSNMLDILDKNNSKSVSENQFEEVYKKLSDRTKDVVDTIMEYRFTSHKIDWDIFKRQSQNDNLKDDLENKELRCLNVKCSPYTLENNKIIAEYMNVISNGNLANLRQEILFNREVAQSGVDTSSSEYLDLESKCRNLLVLWKKDIIDTFSYSDTGREQLSAYIANKYVSKVSCSKKERLQELLQCIIFDNMIDIENPIIAHKQMLSSLYRALYDRGKLKLCENGEYIVCITGSLSVDMRVLLNLLASDGMAKYRCMENMQVLAFTIDEAEAYYEAVQSMGEKKEKVNTVAQNAFEEISKALYSEQLGLYRDNQFSNNKTIVLNTIFDELPVIFNSDACIRPGFSTEDNKVTVPTVFVNVKGTGGKTDAELSSFIYELGTGDHRYLVINEHVAAANEKYMRYDNDDRVNVKLVMNDAIPMCEAQALFNAGVLDRESFRNLWSGRFSKLSLDRQIYLLNKIEELCRSYPSGIDANPALIIQIASALPNFVLQDLTWFDFTKTSPKVVFAYTGEFTMLKTDAVFLHLLNNLGYDVVTFTPSGYTGLECCGSLDTAEWMFNTIDLGKPRFNFDFTSTKSKNSNSSDSGFMGYLKKIFTI